MSKILDKMLKKCGLKWGDVRSNSKIGKFLKKRGVEHSDEIDRILNLPRRKWHKKRELEALQEYLTDMFKLPEGKQELWLLQTAALVDIYDLEGLLGPIGVGEGKTLITRLAPLLLEASRPVLLIPAKLRQKTRDEFAELDEHWKRHSNLEIVSYTKLGIISGAETLNDIAPDLIVADEVHKLKNLRATCTKKVARYMNQHPETIFVGMSGTITKRSLRDFQHLAQWALGKEHAPVPRDPRELTCWSLALDAKVPINQRINTGALDVFVRGKKKPTRDEVRAAFGKRLRETPGVVASRGTSVAASILIEFWDPEIPLEVDKLAERVSRQYEGPDDEPVLSGDEVWRHIRELVCGFYSTWDPEPPKEWLIPRRRWGGFVRRTLEDSETYDSPEQVARACAAEELDSGGLYEHWQIVKNTFKPNPVAVWLDTSVLEQLIERVPDQSLVWVDRIPAARKLAELTGWPFFHKGGLDKSGRSVQSLDGTETVILSVLSNLEGRNLQAWSSNVIVSPLPDGAVMEQVLGRTHRKGQQADEINVLVMLGHKILRSGMDQAFEDAEYIQSQTGSRQRLLLADVVNSYATKSAA